MKIKKKKEEKKTSQSLKEERVPTIDTPVSKREI